MSRYYRKTAPKVMHGALQRKNRFTPTANYYNTPQNYPVFDREKAGRGYRHLVSRKDLLQFIDLLPDWDELSKGLNAVVLAAGMPDTLGWHVPGVVGICAWQRTIVLFECDPSFHDEHNDLFWKLGVHCALHEGYWNVEFNEYTAKAFQLIHVFLHELGHHHDRMTTQSQRDSARGEGYAEAYAMRYEAFIINRYRQVF